MADRRTIREALRRYGDRPDKATTREHYEAEAAEQTGELMALRAEWEDGYAAGFDAATRIFRSPSSICDHCGIVVEPAYDNGRWYWLHASPIPFMCVTSERTCRTITVGGSNLVR